MATAKLPASKRRSPRSHGAMPRRSPFLVWGFERYLTTGFGFRGGYLVRHFHAVRLLRSSVTAFPSEQPLIFFLNHPSWWDPLTAFLLARHIVPERPPYAPIERAALDRYPMLNRVGLFGVDRSPEGVRTFLRTSEAILHSREASLWLTPEGRFTDPGLRPITFEPGLGHLARRIKGLFVPVAVEYRFWDERLPEVLTYIGDPIDTGSDKADAAAWSQRLEQSLEATLARLSVEAASRDASRFQTILTGSAGVGPFYDLGSRLRAFVTGRTYSAEHGGPT